MRLLCYMVFMCLLCLMVTYHALALLYGLHVLALLHGYHDIALVNRYVLCTCFAPWLPCTCSAQWARTIVFALFHGKHELALLYGYVRFACSAPWDPFSCSMCLNVGLTARSVAQFLASPIADPGVESSILAKPVPVRSWRLIMKYSIVIRLLPPSADSRRAVVSYKRKPVYCLIA